MNKPDRDIVLFLGAGFSCNAGLPLMAEFGEEAKKQIGLQEQAEAKRDSKDFRYAAPLLVSAQETFEGFQKLLEQKQVLTIEETRNMETVFCIAEALYESGVKTIDINGSPKGIEVLIEEIQLWLWKTYQQFPPENPLRKNKIEIKVLENFFKIIKDVNVQGKITVLSTNYDLVYEYCSKESNIPCAYPLSWDKDFRAGFGNEHYISQFDEAEGKTIVCKLHGSVNFFENTTESDKKLFVASDLCDGQSIGNSKIRKNLPALFAVDSIWNIRNKYGNGYVPAIIPPTYAKLRGYPWLREIWKEAFEAVKNANKIIFIGYSFPDSDGFMHAFFQGALAMKSNQIQPDIYLVDPDPNDKVHKRYKKFFNSNFKSREPLSLKKAIECNFFSELFER